MTEEEWLKCDDPEPMLEFLKGKASDRKFLLFACGCCRRIWAQITDERSRKAVEMIEKDVEQPVGEPEYNTVFWDAQDATGGEGEHREDDPAYNAAEAAYNTVPGSPNLGRVFCAMATAAYAAKARGANRQGEAKAQTDLLRDVFGNPFRPVAFDPAWRTSDVMLLSRGMYESRDFGPTPILADALQDAGCDSDDLLMHLRDPHATHVHGCWALDLVLGKE